MRIFNEIKIGFSEEGQQFCFAKERWESVLHIGTFVQAGSKIWL